MSPRRVAGRAALGLAALSLLACAPAGYLPARPSPAALPAGSPLGESALPDGEAWLRHYVFLGASTEALGLLSPRRGPYTRDRLVRDLQAGIVHHLEGRHAESNALLLSAEAEVERRLTRSVTRAAGSLLVSDQALLYVPTFTERASIAYYRMLNFMALGEGEAAAVEARRLNAFLLHHEDETGRRCGANGFFQYLTSFAYAAEGAWNDAVVSLRQSERAYAECAPAGGVPEPVLADLARAALRSGMPELAPEGAGWPAGSPLDGSHGRLLVLVEGGFAPAKVPRLLHVPIFPEEVEGLAGGEAGEILAAAATVSARLVSSLTEQATWGASWDDDPLVRWGRSLEGAHMVRLAWTDHLLPDHPSGMRVEVGSHSGEMAMAEPLAQRLLEEFQAQRAAVITRAVARAISKYLLTREAEQRAEKEGGRAAGFLAGLFTNLTLNALEEADTRSWSLLPQRIGVLHLELPAGEHAVRVEVGGGGRLVELGTVRVEAGRTAVFSARLWPESVSGVWAAEVPAG
jgi:uncharacterized protein